MDQTFSKSENIVIANLWGCNDLIFLLLKNMSINAFWNLEKIIKVVGFETLKFKMHTIIYQLITVSVSASNGFISPSRNLNHSSFPLFLIFMIWFRDFLLRHPILLFRILCRLFRQISRNTNNCFFNIFIKLVLTSNSKRSRGTLYLGRHSIFQEALYCGRQYHFDSNFSFVSK